MSDQDAAVQVEETIFAKPTIAETRERLTREKAERVAKEKARKEELDKEPNFITIHADHKGMLFAKFQRGRVPQELAGKFTSKARILEICKRRGYTVREE